MFWNIRLTLFYFDTFDDSPITVSSFWFFYFSEEHIEFNSFGCLKTKCYTQNNVLK